MEIKLEKLINHRPFQIVIIIINHQLKILKEVKNIVIEMVLSILLLEAFLLLINIEIIYSQLILRLNRIITTCKYFLIFTNFYRF